MNVLLVDDQKAIVESLKKGIHWENLPVRQVYTACSADRTPHESGRNLAGLWQRPCRTSQKDQFSS